MPRFLRAAVVAAVSLTSLAACGGAATKSAAPAAPSTTSTTAAPTPLELVLASSQKMADTRTMRFTMSMGTPDGTFGGDGVMDTSGAAPLMSMTLDMGAMVPPAERKNGTTMSMVLNDQAIYMKFPGVEKETGGKHWIRLDLATLSAGDDALSAIASQLRDADPSNNLEYLEGAQDVVLVGSEDVKGVPTQHYKFTIDMNKALEGTPEGFRAAVSTAMAQMGGNLLPGEVWLGDDGLPRRFVYDMDLSKAAGKLTVVHFLMEMSDFGQPVQITIPPDNDMVDADSAGFGLGS